MARETEGRRKPDQPPPGFRLRHTLRAHERGIHAVAWTADGRLLLSASRDGTVEVWDLAEGRAVRTLEGHMGAVTCVAATPDGRLAVSASADGTLRVWDLDDGRTVATMEGHSETVYSVAVTPDCRVALSGALDKSVRAWDLAGGRVVRTLAGHAAAVYAVVTTPDGRFALSASWDHTLRLWDLAEHRCVRILEGHADPVLTAAVTPDGRFAISGSRDGTLRVWRVADGRTVRTLEGHTRAVIGAAISQDGRWIASKSLDGTVRVWQFTTGQTAGVLPEAQADYYLGQAVAFHPQAAILATLGGEHGQDIRVWDLDFVAMTAAAGMEPMAHYRNAKVVLVGDTGVGKSGLGLVLTGKPYQATDSTAGRRVETLQIVEVPTSDGCSETRETLLWDLAGQPGYRLIHQMHLGEVAVALVVFDARSETDPLAGVRHWNRALELAQQRQGQAAVPLRKYLVVARADRGGVPVSRARIETLVREMGFDGFFETSAKEGWQIAELAEAVRGAVDWEALPQVVSSQLFARIKGFLLDEKKVGRLLATSEDLFVQYCRAGPGKAPTREEFDTCVGRLENRDLVRRLSFGGLVLLQPELLDAYASAMILAAKDEPQGLGSMAEEDAAAGRFRMPGAERIADRAQEQLVLLATVEELLRHDLALRDTAEEGTYLVFPSQFVREWEEAPEPRGKTVSYRFDGPVQNIYATLAVRLAHSGRFDTARTQMWRNAAIYAARGGGRCGVYLREFAEARGLLAVFFDPDVNHQTRIHFEDFVEMHLKRRAIDDSVEELRPFVCASCSTAVPDNYAQGRLKRGLDWIECAVCGLKVSLAPPAVPAPADRIVVVGMNSAADKARDRNAAVFTVRGKCATEDFDVFLCHNSRDKDTVKQVAGQLKEQGLLPWLDEWEIRPGWTWQDVLEEQIEKIKSAAVFIGPAGIGPWQDQELKAFLREFAQRECPVIPVLLPGLQGAPPLPLFLKAFHVVDFRKKDPDPLEQLVWGITGRRV